MTYTLGSRLGTDVEQVQHSRLIIFWGANAVTSNLHLWSRAQQAKRAGARLIAIDPYRSLTAEKCHRHIALLPGTDAALALGLMHVLLREGWLDRDALNEQITRVRDGATALLERLGATKVSKTERIVGGQPFVDECSAALLRNEERSRPPSTIAGANVARARRRPQARQL